MLGRTTTLFKALLINTARINRRNMTTQVDSVVEKPDLTDAVDQTDPVQTETPNPNPKKRSFNLVVYNVPKKDDAKKFRKLLDSLDVHSVKKLKKPFGVTQAKISFENEQDKDACKNKLVNYELKGQKLQVKETDELLVQQTERQGHDNKPPKQLPENILDVVTPWHNVPYDEQIKRKALHLDTVLRDITKRIRKESKYDVPKWVTKMSYNSPCCPSEGVREAPQRTGYRNKLEFTVGKALDGQSRVGFLLGRAQDGHFAVASSDTWPHVPSATEVLRSELEALVQRSLHAVWDKLAFKGVWRLLMSRTTREGVSLVVVQIDPSSLDQGAQQTLEETLQQWAKEHNAKHKEQIGGLFLQHHSGVSNAAPHDALTKLIHGDQYIYETLLGLKFRISPKSFFQVNTSATEVLYAIVRDWCGQLDTYNTILDICCGIGTIGLIVAQHAPKAHIVGLEIIEEAIEDAKFNAELNGIKNVSFYAGKAEDMIGNALKQVTGSCIGIVDPPRAGLHIKTLKAIRACEQIDRLVYVSCNQNALIADAANLCRSVSTSMFGTPFVPVKALAVDMFPHTEHCEVVVLFERLKSDTINNNTTASAAETKIE